MLVLLLLQHVGKRFVSWKAKVQQMLRNERVVCLFVLFFLQIEGRGR